MSNKLVCGIIGIVTLLILFYAVNEAYGYSFVGVTNHGVEFPIVSSGIGNGTGESMIDGMGIQSRIIQKDFTGYITHGIGNIGKDSSIIPYIPVNSNTDFTALVESGDTIETHVIPQFWNEYKMNNGTLTNITIFKNVLDYADSLTHEGTINISNNNGIVITGNGKGVIELLNYTGQNIVLRGDTGTGIIKVVTSSLDLINDDFTEYGYLSYSGSNPGTNGISIVGGLESTHTGKYDSTVWHEGTYHQHGGRGWSGAPHGHPGWYTYPTDSTSTLVKINSGDHKKITGHTNTGSITAFRLYDTLPSYEKLKFTGDFENNYSFTEKTYLYVSLNSGTMQISGEEISHTPFVKITNLTPNIPYQIIKDGLPIVTGMTSPLGSIIIDELKNNSNIVGGILHLYPDSLSYRGSFSTVIFDNLNDNTIHLDTIEDLVYTVHAYVNIPITGTPEITDITIHGSRTSEELNYLNGNYTIHDELQIPIIPRFNSVTMKINGVETSLDYSNVLGGTGIKIANSEVSTIKKSDWNNRITSMESIVGTTAYVIATSDGTINALVTESISGSISITNHYKLERIPPPPPDPPRRDPLSGWVDVYVNGEFVKLVSLGNNPYPDFTPNSGLSGTTAYQSVVYSYPDYVVMGNVTIDVESGDFVEFYLYGKIHGDIDSYSVPGGYRLISESGYGVATVKITSASIQTSMS